MTAAPAAEILHPGVAIAARNWSRKASLRAVYGSYYSAMAARVRKGGRVLEIGAGSGHSRHFLSNLDLVRLDILPAPWIDIVADAHEVPLGDESIDAIVMLDVVHHLADLPKFFQEVERLLRPAGRCIMIDPAITPVSGIFFRSFHAEPVDMRANPMVRQEYGQNKDPFESNQALPTLLFKQGNHRREFERRFPGLRIAEVRQMSLFAYPMCGGFQDWSLISGPVARGLLKLESALEPLLGPLMAFRLLVTVEKVGRR